MTVCANPACGREFERKVGRGRPQLICNPCRIQAGRLKPPELMVYDASTIKKRVRRTKAVVTSIRDAIRDILEDDHPQTVRQVFYALTSTTSRSEKATRGAGPARVRRRPRQLED